MTSDQSIPGDALAFRQCIVEDRNAPKELLENQELRSQLIELGLQGRSWIHYVISKAKTIQSLSEVKIPLSFYVEHSIAYLSSQLAVLERQAKKGDINAAKILCDKKAFVTQQMYEAEQSAPGQAPPIKKRRRKKTPEAEVQSTQDLEIPF